MKDRTQMVSSFDKIAAASVATERHPRLDVGDYTLSLVEAKHIPDGYEGESFVFTFDVVSAREIPGGKPTPEKQRVAYVWNASKNKYAFNDIKTVIASLFGATADECTASDVRRVFEPAQELTGFRVGCRVAPGTKINKETGQPYINARFYAVKE